MSDRGENVNTPARLKSHDEKFPIEFSSKEKMSPSTQDMTASCDDSKHIFVYDQIQNSIQYHVNEEESGKANTFKFQYFS